MVLNNVLVALARQCFTRICESAFALVEHATDICDDNRYDAEINDELCSFMTLTTILP